MKHIEKLCFCLAGGLLLNAGLRAADSTSPDNPYATIVTRNVFSINPPPPVDPNAKPVEPPPKITPNGIMGVYGHLQVLYKVAFPPRDGHPGKDQSYVLSEGQAEDEIEVTKIDNTAGVVTFNNHGTVQELPLLVTSASVPSSSSALMQGGPWLGRNFHRGFAPGGGNASNNGENNLGTFTPPVNRFGRSNGFGAQNSNPNAISGGINGNMNGSANPGSKLGVALSGGGGFSSQPGAASSSGGISSAQFNPSGMSPAQIQWLIALQKAKYTQEGNPAASIMPPSAFDSEPGNPQ